MFKFTLLIIAAYLQFCAPALAQLGPVKGKGQSQSTFNTVERLEAPHSQVTVTGDKKVLLETGNQNLLENPGWESSTVTDGLGTSSTTTAIETGASNISTGKRSLKATLSFGSVLNSKAYTIPNGWYGKNGQLTCQIKSSLTFASSSFFQIISSVGPTTITQVDLQGMAPSSYRELTMNFIFPSSDTLSWSLFFGNTSGDVFLDDCYLGLTTNIGTVFPGTATQTYTPTVANLGAGSATVTGEWRQIGDSIEVTIQAVKDGTNGTGSGTVTFSLPNNFTIKSSGIIGSGGVYLKGFYQDVNGGDTGQVSAFASDYNKVFLYKGGIFQGSTFTAGKVVQLKFTAPIDQFSSSVQAIKVSQTPFYVDAVLSGGNPNLGVSNVAVDSEITDSSLTLTPASGTTPVGVMCSGTNAATAPSSSATTCSAGSESVGINFNIPRPGWYKTCFQASHNLSADTSEVVGTVFKINETPTNAQTVTTAGDAKFESSIFGAATDETNVIPFRTCQSFYWNSVGIKGVRLMYRQAVSGTPDASVVLMATSGNKDRTGKWTVEPITQEQANWLINNSVTSSSSGLERVERARVTMNGSTCTINSQSGSWMSAPLSPGTGVCTFTMTGFSAAPQCVCTRDDNSVSSCQMTSTTTTTAGAIYLVGSGGSASNGSANIICMGPR